MKEEIWKPIKGFERSYEISNLGAVRELSRTVLVTKKGSFPEISKRKSGHVNIYTNKTGFKRVSLVQKNGKRYWFFVYRLLADAFLDGANKLGAAEPSQLENRIVQMVNQHRS